MDSVFRKLCHYYIAEADEEILNNIKEENPEEFELYNEKAKKFIKKLTIKTAKLGFAPDFESFCNLLEEYINKKDSLEDEEKRLYLKILMTLSEIHEINLREELERYISYKQKDQSEEKNQIFKKFCRYNLNKDSNPEEFNELKQLATENNLDFKEIQKEAIMYVEEIKILAENIGYDLDEMTFEDIVQKYNSQRNKLSDYDKARYLRVLLYLSEIYEINLRKLLDVKKENIPVRENSLSENDDINLDTLIKQLSNPLDNHDLLGTLLDQRYNNGYFNIKDITLNKFDIVIENEETNYHAIEAELAHRLYRIFLDKFNNYAFDDLNQEYLNLITEEDLSRLEILTEEDIKSIIELINNHESPHYIIKKHKLTDNLYIFIEKSLSEAIDIRKEHIGIGNNSLFVNNDEPYTIRIYLNGPEHETLLLLKDYIQKCVSFNVNYDMKAMGDNNNNQEGTILFANINDITQKINIIEDIFTQNPEYAKVFTTPIYSSGRINDSLYGISHSGVVDENNRCINSYNDYFNNVCEVAYYRTISKIVLDIITDEKAKNIINNFIGLREVSFNKAKMISPELAEYNGINFDTIKDLVNQYIPLVSSTLSIYMDEQDKKEILITEFRKSLLYISNICQNRDRRAASNIAISSYLEAYLNN